MDAELEKINIEKFNYIVIGGGIAGVTCAEHLHILDHKSSILLITASDYVKTVTNVQPITKTLDLFDVEERPRGELEKYCPNVSVLTAAVTKLDSENQVVYTLGREFYYEKLCICAGATPKTIFPDNPYILWIRDTDSAKLFQEKMSKSKRILIVGNGGIATEIVYEVTGIEIIWAIKDKSINAVFIDPGAAEFLKPNLQNEKLEDKKPSKRRKYTVEPLKDSAVMGGALGPDWHSGLELKGSKERHVTMETEVEVQRILTPSQMKENPNLHLCPDSQGNWPVYAELTNKRVYGCDFIISATGVVPNTSVFMKDNNFVLGEDGGLLVNDKMETSVRNVYAAGDVCSAGWDQAHHWFQMRLWTQARQMGSYAAKCMWASLTGEELYMDFCFELFSHATKFFGLKVILLGLYNGQKLDRKYEVLLRMTKGKEYVKCVMVDGRMQGATLIGETDMEETFENLILNQMDLSSYGADLLDPSVDIEDYFD